MSESRPEDQDPVHAAELQLIDALLSSMSRRAGGDRDARIRRVMDAVAETPTVPGKRTRSRLWQSLLAVAACLTLACTLSWLQFSRESRADDVLIEIAGVSQEKIDRVYSVRRIVSTTGGPDQREGRLYLRGCEGLVIVCGDVVLGRNTHEFWFVPQEGPVVVAEDFEWMVGASEREKREIGLLNALAIDSRSLPLVQLSSAVELMRQDYEVTLDDELLHGRPVDLLVGTLRDRTSGLPDTIRLWSDKQSRTINRAELEWRKPRQRSPANIVILELIAAERVGPDWYDRETHHRRGQPVHRILSGS